MDDDDMHEFRGQISQKHLQVRHLFWILGPLLSFINNVSLSFSKVNPYLYAAIVFLSNASWLWNCKKKKLIFNYILLDW